MPNIFRRRHKDGLGSTQKASKKTSKKEQREKEAEQRLNHNRNVLDRIMEETSDRGSSPASHAEEPHEASSLMGPCNV